MRAFAGTASTIWCGRPRAAADRGKPGADPEARTLLPISQGRRRAGGRSRMNNDSTTAERPAPDRIAVAFARVLRGAGLDVPVGATLDFARAIDCVGLS